jgi:hypothetical protein
MWGAGLHTSFLNRLAPEDNDTKVVLSLPPRLAPVCFPRYPRHIPTPFSRMVRGLSRITVRGRIEDRLKVFQTIYPGSESN